MIRQKQEETKISLLEEEEEEEATAAWLELPLRSTPTLALLSILTVDL